MDQVILTLLVGIIASMPGIINVMRETKKDVNENTNVLIGRLQTDNSDLREENRKLRGERNELESKIDELDASLDAARKLVRTVQEELEKYRKPPV
jgi:uncharacterized protein YlxW (UPF0749 family)